MLLNRTIKYYVNIISFLAAVSWYWDCCLIVQPTSKFNLPPSSNNSTWPAFQYVSMDTSLDQQYENCCYISCRKYNQNWRYCHRADIYNRRFFFGFSWRHLIIIHLTPDSSLPNLCKPAKSFILC
jgi:hypothetical protein